MADVLVGAKQQAEKIILETLNGYNFARQYVAMGDLLMRLGRKRDELLALKGQVTEVLIGQGSVSAYIVSCLKIFYNNYYVMYEGYCTY